jgi:hypothetical protein
MIVLAIVSIIGISGTGACEHERKGAQERPSGPNDAHGAGRIPQRN